MLGWKERKSQRSPGDLVVKFNLTAISRNNYGNFLGGPGIKNPRSNAGDTVPSLVGKLRSHQRDAPVPQLTQHSQINKLVIFLKEIIILEQALRCKQCKQHSYANSVTLRGQKVVPAISLALLDFSTFFLSALLVLVCLILGFVPCTHSASLLRSSSGSQLCLYIGNS